MPDGVGAKAVLGSGIGAPRTVYADTPITVGTLIFNNANLYNLSGAASLAMQAVRRGCEYRCGYGKSQDQPSADLYHRHHDFRGGKFDIDPFQPGADQSGQDSHPHRRRWFRSRLRWPIESGRRNTSLGPAAMSVFGVPTMAGNARINVGTQSLNVDYHGQPSEAGGVEAKLMTGYAAGAWSGEGIMTSASTSTKGLGWIM